MSAGTEVPERAIAILRSADQRGRAGRARCSRTRRRRLLAVHDRALIEHLATIWADWEAGRYPADYGRDRVVPYVFPTAAMLAGLPLRAPAATHGQVGTVLLRHHDPGRAGQLGGDPRRR